MAYYNEWTGDKHSMSQTNPFFLEIYKQFKQDHPDKNGNCALCHNPEAVLDRDAPAGRLYLKPSLGYDIGHNFHSYPDDPV